MSGKRANNEGSIYKRGDGRWVASVSLERGQRKYLYGRTRQEVGRKLTAALKARQDGLPLAGERQTVRRYLESWLESARPSVRPRTWERYEQYVRLHAIPELGHLTLAKLGPQHLQRLYASRLESGLSATSVAHLHAVLHRALGQAARWGLVPRNVASLATPPRIRRQEMATLSPEQARALLETAQGDRLHALYVVALSTGMRQGELLALKWRDVDLDAARLQVRATLQRVGDGFDFAEPKTARSRRQVALTATAIAALRRHRVAQAEERLRMGAAWEDNDLVFANEVGRPIEATNLIRRSFHPLLERAVLPRIRFHDLRHTAATLMLGRGVHPKVVAEMLGHSQIAVTLDLYSHVTPTMQREATAALDAVLRG
jgi:integrase